MFLLLLSPLLSSSFFYSKTCHCFVPSYFPFSSHSLVSSCFPFPPRRFRSSWFPLRPAFRSPHPYLRVQAGAPRTTLREAGWAKASHEARRRYPVRRSMETHLEDHERDAAFQSETENEETLGDRRRSREQVEGQGDSELGLISDRDRKHQRRHAERERERERPHHERSIDTTEANQTHLCSGRTLELRPMALREPHCDSLLAFSFR